VAQHSAEVALVVEKHSSHLRELKIYSRTSLEEEIHLLISWMMMISVVLDLACLEEV